MTAHLLCRAACHAHYDFRLDILQATGVCGDGMIRRVAVARQDCAQDRETKFMTDNCVTTFVNREAMIEFRRSRHISDEQFAQITELQIVPRGHGPGPSRCE